MTAPEGNPGRGSWQWTACGASVVGSQHVKRGLGCDDAFAYGHVEEFIIAAVADGAGSVSGTSAWGSYTACQAVLNRAMRPRFVNDFDRASADNADEIMRWLFNGAREGVTKRAEAMGLPVGLLATTLSVAIASRDLLILGQIGDGIMATESADGIATHLIEEKDEYANATWFLHSDEAFEQSFRTTTRPGVSAFALSTDGMSYKITDIVTGQPFEPFFKGAWQRVRTGAAASDFAALLRGIEDDQTGDDKTMVLATLNWVEDAYYPSARPVVRNDVSSPPPPPVRPASIDATRPAKEAVAERPLEVRPAATAPAPPKPPSPGGPPDDSADAAEGRRRLRARRRGTDAATLPLESK